MNNKKEMGHFSLQELKIITFSICSLPIVLSVPDTKQIFKLRHVHVLMKFNAVKNY